MKKILLILTPIILATAMVAAGLSSTNASAISMKNFDAGNIIDDATFYDATSMSASKIQEFLDKKVPKCDTQGSGYYADGKSVKEYWTPKGEPAPYTCLKDWEQDTPKMNGVSGICKEASARTNRSAAEIITDVGRACGVSPKVLLVLLEKEKSLVTDRSPLSHNSKWSQYKYATGFACPDTAPCDPDEAGFFNQVYSAAYQFKLYRANPTNYNYIAGRSNYIQYNPSTSCGGSYVNIKNQATAGLYNYTPYQPNKATKEAPIGTTVTCGAYGNKNFWWLFTSWFGFTHAVFSDLDNPRWMQLKNDAPKYNLATQTPYQHVYPKGMKFYFPTKLTIEGTTFLRNEFNTKHKDNTGFRLADLEPLDLNFVSLDNPRWMETDSDTSLIRPDNGDRVGDTIPKGTKLFFPDKTKLDGTVMLRTMSESKKSSDLIVLYSKLKTTNVDKINFDNAKWMMATTSTDKLDLNNGLQKTGEVVDKGDMDFYGYKVKLNGKWYASTSKTNSIVVPLSNLKSPTVKFTDMETPRYMELGSNSSKIDPLYNRDMGSYNKGRQIYFSSKVAFNGKTYYRTAYNTKHNDRWGMPGSDLIEIPATYIPLENPRWMTVKKPTHKIDPITGERKGGLLTVGTKIYFPTKIIIGGETYVRTQHNTDHGYNNAIPISSLRS